MTRTFPNRSVGNEGRQRRPSQPDPIPLSIVSSDPDLFADVAFRFRGAYSRQVSGLKEIKAAIDELSSQERCELMAMLNPPANDEWDEQMVKDAAAGGKLDRLRETVHEDYQAGKCSRWPVREVPRSS